MGRKRFTVGDREARAKASQEKKVKAFMDSLLELMNDFNGMADIDPPAQAPMLRRVRALQDRADLLHLPRAVDETVLNILDHIDLGTRSRYDLIKSLDRVSERTDWVEARAALFS